MGMYDLSSSKGCLAETLKRKEKEKKKNKKTDTFHLFPLA